MAKCLVAMTPDSEILLPNDPNLGRRDLELPQDLADRARLAGTDFELSESGLAVPRLRDRQIVQAVRQLLVPESARQQPEIVQPTQEEVLQFGQHEQATEVRKRSLQEIMILGSNPRAFVIQEVLHHFGVQTPAELPEDLQEVLQKIDTPQAPQRPYTHYEESMKRVEKVRKRGENSYTYTEPGSLETVALLVTDILNDQEIRNSLGDKNGAESLAKILVTLLGRYRMDPTTPWMESSLEYLPNMPDLVLRLIDKLDGTLANRKLRFLMYDIIEQIQLPEQQYEQILWKMDELRDLEHPLAYQLHLRLMDQDDPESSVWLQDQETRHQEMVGLLYRESGEVFLQYEELKKLSKRLVLSTSPFHIEPAQIGMEVEFSHRRRAPLAPLEDAWVEGTDVENLEMRRNDRNLNLDTQYLDSFTNLAHFFRDTAAHLSSIHIHFDRDHHPFEPELGGILGNQNETIRESGINTWEVRGLVVPSERQQHRLAASAVANVMQMYIFAAQETNRPQEKIDECPFDVSVEQALFGHICAYLLNPEARLAALKVVQNPLMFRAINPAAFTQSFSESAIRPLFLSLRNQMLNGYQKESLIAAMTSAPLQFYSELMEIYQSDLPGDENSIQRAAIVSALGQDPDRFEGKLLQALQDKSPLVRRAVVGVWGNQPQKYSNQLRAVYDTDPDRGTRAEVVTIWGTDPKYFAEDLNHALADASISVQSEVLRVWLWDSKLFRNEISRAYGILQSEQYAGFRKNMVWAWRSDPRFFHDELVLASGDPDEQVRKLAEAVLTTNR